MVSEAQAIKYLRSAQTIRRHCMQVGERAEQGTLRYFNFHAERLAEAVAYVVEEINRNYPAGSIPIHGRLRHLDVGGVNRPALVQEALKSQGREEVARALFELVVISVLLDGGAGSRWQYKDALSGALWRRSEGLAVASFALFHEGLFSADARHPLRVEGKALRKLQEERLGKGMQVSEQNPLLGLVERTELLRQLGVVITSDTSYFSGGEKARLGDLFDYLVSAATRKQGGNSKQISAVFILSTLLEAFAPIWPHGLKFANCNVGDVGRYKGIRGEFGTDGLIPFHKLSQWLSYSLLEIFSGYGLEVVETEQLTGLPEYRNGGLLLDLQVLTLKDSKDLEKEHLPESELVVEWRALTVCLLDKIAEGVRKTLGKSAEELSLASILQGGTWSAGRRIAALRRPDGGSPLRITLDGTIF